MISVETFPRWDLDTDVDLLVRHAPTGQVVLVLQEIVAPARQRSRGVGVVDLSLYGVWVQVPTKIEVFKPVF